MTIIHEQPSGTGMFRSNLLQDVQNVYKVKNFLLGSYKQPVIRCVFTNKKAYHIGFFKSELVLDDVLQRIKSRKEDTIVLTLKDVFYKEIVPDSELYSLVRKGDTKRWIKTQLRLIMKNNNLNFAQVVHLDAFNKFTVEQLHQISEGLFVPYPNEIEEIWHKCLFCPKWAKEKGINRYQFFKQLVINNNDRI